MTRAAPAAAHASATASSRQAAHVVDHRGAGLQGRARHRRSPGVHGDRSALARRAAPPRARPARSRSSTGTASVSVRPDSPPTSRIAAPSATQADAPGGELVRALRPLGVGERVGGGVHDPHEHRTHEVELVLAQSQGHAASSGAAPGAVGDGSSGPRSGTGTGAAAGTMPSARASSSQSSSSARMRGVVPAELSAHRPRDGDRALAHPARAAGARRAAPGGSGAAARRRPTRPARGRTAKAASATMSGRSGEIRRASAGSAAAMFDHAGARRGRSGPRGARGSRRPPRRLGQRGRVHGLAELDLVRPAGRLAALALHDPVHRQLRHPAPGGELPAGDRHEPRARLVQLGLARDVHGLLRVPGRDQRPHARVRAGEVAGAELGAEEPVHGLEEVADVLLAGRRRARAEPS